MTKKTNVHSCRHRIHLNTAKVTERLSKINLNRDPDILLQFDPRLKNEHYIRSLVKITYINLFWYKIKINYQLLFTN